MFCHHVSERESRWHYVNNSELHAQLAVPQSLCPAESVANTSEFYATFELSRYGPETICMKY